MASSKRIYLTTFCLHYKSYNRMYSCFVLVLIFMFDLTSIPSFFCFTSTYQRKHECWRTNCQELVRNFCFFRRWYLRYHRVTWKNIIKTTRRDTTTTGDSDIVSGPDPIEEPFKCATLAQSAWQRLLHVPHLKSLKLFVLLRVQSITPKKHLNLPAQAPAAITVQL